MRNLILSLLVLVSFSLYGDVFVFYSSSCVSCEEIMKNVIYEVKEKTNDINWYFYDIEKDEGMELFVKVRNAYSIETNAIPLVVCVNHYIAGESINRDTLIAFVKEYGKGKLEIKSLENQNVFGKILFFYKSGCSHCNAVGYVLSYLKKKNPYIAIDSFNINNKENIAILENIEKSAGIEEKKRLIVPVVVAGKDVLIGDKITYNNIIEGIKRGGEYSISKENVSIVKRFENMGILPVIIAGLADGINPCAFATIIFLISYLSSLKRTNREILYVGILFSVGVFITYIVSGFLAGEVLDALMGFKIVGDIIYGFMGIFLIVLSYFNLKDAYLIKIGKSTEMTLRLPDSIHRRIHGFIKKGAGFKFIFIGSLFIGVFVSLFELACTGQVYLPTIMYILSVPSLRMKSFIMLVIYNIMFILPLIVVSIVSFKISGSKEWKRIFEKSGIVSKIVLFFFFLFLGLFMLYIVYKDIFI